MKLIPRNYFLDDIFNDLATISTNSMKCDVYEKDGNYNIEADIPGYKKEDISLEVDDGYLTIKAKHEEEKKDESKNYLCQERIVGSLERSFYIGDLKTDDIAAKFENGILKITVPKVVKDENKKLINIE